MLDSFSHTYRQPLYTDTCIVKKREYRYLCMVIPEKLKKYTTNVREAGSAANMIKI